MAAVNSLAGDDYDAGLDYGPEILDPQSLYGGRDGTELIVALIVLAALGILVAFQRGGFRAVITVGR